MKSIYFHLLSVLIIIITGGCGSSYKATKIWRSESIEGIKYKNALILLEESDPTTRNRLEGITAEEITRQGLKAKPSYAVIKDPFDPNIEQLIKSQDMEAFILFRVVDMTEYDSKTWDAVHSLAWLAGEFEDRASVKRVDAIHRAAASEFNIEVSLWDVKTSQPVWSAVFDSYVDPDQQNDPAEIQKFVEILVRELRGIGIVN